MHTKLIACQTLKNELNAALKRCQVSHEIIWIPSGLHNFPKKLNKALKEALNQCFDCSRVLMAMGFCGNSLTGLETGDYSLIIPRVDDCISLLLGSLVNKKKLPDNLNTYFMTEGWIKGERNIWVEYEHSLEKYGEETGKEIFDMMFSHYKYIALLDTGCFPLQENQKESQRIAAALNLQHKVVPAQTTYLEELLKGPWNPERFLIIPPHSTITDKDQMCL